MTTVGLKIFFLILFLGFPGHLLSSYIPAAFRLPEARVFYFLSYTVGTYILN